MIDTHFNMFDAAVLGILALSCLFAYFRGIVREVLSLLAWIGAGIFAFHYFPQAAEALQGHFKKPLVANIVAVAGLYIIALLVFSIINRMIIKTIKSGGTDGMLDNLLGLLFGALRGVLIVSLAYFMISMTLPEKEYPDWLKKSVTRPYVEQGAVALVRLAPDYLREMSSLQKKATERLKAVRETPETEEEMPADTERHEDVGYSRTSNRSLDRLIDNATQAPPP